MYLVTTHTLLYYESLADKHGGLNARAAASLTGA